MRATFCILFIALLAFPVRAESEDSVADRALNARPMTVDELFGIYENRTWLWKEGAAYFSSKERSFRAWTRNNDGTVATGTWFPTSRGKLCFRANWKSAKGSTKVLTCFSHRIDDSAYYQRREPDGEWYVFRNLDVMRKDTFSKIVPGDYVKHNYEKFGSKLE